MVVVFSSFLLFYCVPWACSYLPVFSRCFRRLFLSFSFCAQAATMRIVDLYIREGAKDQVRAAHREKIWHVRTGSYKREGDNRPQICSLAVQFSFFAA